MTFMLPLKTVSLITMGISFLFIACGKKPETKVESPPEIQRPSQTQIDTYLSKQDVSCENNQACPNYIAKLVVIQGGQYKYCTGFLTEDNVVATSSSCLPNLLRLNGQDCSKDVFLFFPRTWNRPAERVGCNKVLYVSQLPGQDPLLWRDDVAFLELDRNLSYRREARISREGVADKRSFTTWMIDQQDQHNALIRRGQCLSVHNSYINPLATSDASPNMLFADCPLTKGGEGAPVIDSRGRVRAMISRTIDQVLRRYLESTGLLVDGLKEMVHATNFACSPTHSDNEMKDDRECLKDLTYSVVDRLRSEMLSTDILFKEMRKQYLETLNQLSPYVEFGVKLMPKGDVQETEIVPNCFRPLSGWLDSLSSNRNIYVHDIILPRRNFRRVMDSHGKIKGAMIDKGDTLTYVQFSLRNLRSTNKSSVLMWSQSDELRTFPNISEECRDSLF